jgi:glycosyltransferase involved in cell wall biosynthesis
MKNVTVDILMSTFNGEQFICEQIDSIIHQTYAHWKLIIRDDGSTDTTVKIINEYVLNYPEKIELIKNDHENLGYKKSFLRLLTFSKADYIMFADQDDFWLPKKIERSLQSILKEEIKFPELPILSVTDIAICNESLTVQIPSYFKDLNVFKQRNTQFILLASILHGCSFIFNAKLRNLTISLFPEKSVDTLIINGHDNLISIVAATCGKIVFENDVLMKHRIHHKNQIGYSVTNKPGILESGKTILKYLFNNKFYRKFYFESKIKENKQILEEIKALNRQLPYVYDIFLKLEQTSYFKRKIHNLYYPYVICPSYRSRVIYILCF